MGYCAAVIGMTCFFIYKKTELPVKHIVAFGAGILFIFIFFDLFPHIFQEDIEVSKTVIFVLAGFLVNAFSEIYILPKLKFLNRILPAKKHDCREHDLEYVHYHLLPAGTGCSAMACFILCAFFDGLRLAGAFITDIKTAVIMSIGLLLHLLPESVTVVGIGLSSGFSRKSVVKIISLFCLAFLGGCHAFFLFSYIEYLHSFVLPFATGLFLYVCFVHLVPLVIKLKVKKWFFAGAVVFLAILQASRLWFPH